MLRRRTIAAAQFGPINRSENRLLVIERLIELSSAHVFLAARPQSIKAQKKTRTPIRIT